MKNALLKTFRSRVAGLATPGLTLAAAVLLSGCIDSTTVVEVKQDGSGFVTEVTYLSPVLNHMIQGFTASMTNAVSGSGGAEIKVNGPMNPQMDRKQYENKAKEMGAGVTVINVQEVKRTDGATGVRVDYAFPDVTQLRITPGRSDQQTPAGEGVSMKTEKTEKPITFEFLAGSPAKLAVIMPPRDKQAASEPAAENPPADAAQQQAMMAMMKPMLQDLRMRLRIKVDGEIQKSNAAHVQVGGTNHKKQYVTLFDVDFSKILDNPKYADKLAALNKADDPGAAQELLKDIPGIQIETADRVDIEFQ